MCALAPKPAPPRRRWLRALGGTAVALLAATLAAAALWWVFSPFRRPSLAHGWAATVLVLAGDGIAEVRDGDAGVSRFADPFGVAIAADGTIYIADGAESHRIRRITPAGLVTTLAGGTRGFADGIGTAASFDTPSGLTLDASGMLYVADTGNNAIRRVTPEGIVSTVAGNGTPGYRDGPVREARFNGPVGVAAAASGRLIVADTYNDRIRAIDPDGTVDTLAGSAKPGAADGLPTEATFDTPSGVAIDSSGIIYVADTANGRLRTINPSGLVTTPEWAPGFIRPIGIALSSAGDIYVTDERGVVEIAADRSARTVAGSTPGYQDGPGRDARFRRPAGIALAGAGRLIVADAGNALVRLVAAPSLLELHTPAAPRIDPRFDVEAFGRQPLLWPIAPLEGPHEVVGTLGEARGGEGMERVHVGIDVRADQGTPVRAVRDGVVATPVSVDGFDSLNESLRVGPLAYVHIRVGRTRSNEVFDAARFAPGYDDGQLVGIRVKRGARFTTGDVIGTVNAFNHVHLNVGWPGEEHNPLGFRLVRFKDTVAPTIAPRGVKLYDDRWQPFTRRVRGRIVVSGSVRIVVDAWDQADGNRPNRRLGMFELGYQVLDRDGSPTAGFDAVQQTQRFDRLSTAADVARVVYAPGSGIPFYRGGRTQFLYIVTNSLREGIASSGFWDTTEHLPGDYVVRVWVSDVRGNVALANRDVPVAIVAPEAAGSSTQAP